MHTLCIYTINLFLKISTLFHILREVHGFLAFISGDCHALHYVNISFLELKLNNMLRLLLKDYEIVESAIALCQHFIFGAQLEQHAQAPLERL